MKTTPRIIVPIGPQVQTYRINGVTYHIHSKYEKKKLHEDSEDLRSRVRRCLILDKNLLTQVMENDIIPAGTVYSAAEKEVTA